MSKQPHPLPLQAQQALALLLSKLVRRLGAGSLSSTIAPPDHPHENSEQINLRVNSFCRGLII